MRRHLGGLAVSAWAWAAFAGQAGAATIHVNTTSMVDNPNDGVCSFREALAAAFSEAPHNECTASAAPNTIVFDQDGTYSTGGMATPFLSDVRNELFVHGTGHVITLDGGGYHRIFRLSTSTSDLTVSNLTISNCNAEGGGGGGAVILESSLSSFTALNV